MVNFAKVFDPIDDITSVTLFIWLLIVLDNHIPRQINHAIAFESTQKISKSNTTNTTKINVVYVNKHAMHNQQKRKTTINEMSKAIYCNSCIDYQGGDYNPT